MDNSIPPTNFMPLKKVVVQKSIIVEKKQYLDSILSESWLNYYFKLHDNTNNINSKDDSNNN